MKSIKKLLVCIVSVMVVGSLMGCTSEGTYMNSATDTTKEDGVVDEMIDDVIDGVDDLGEDAMDGVDDMADDAMDGAEDLGEDMMDGVDDMADDAMDGVDNATDDKADDTMGEDYTDGTQDSIVE